MESTHSISFSSLRRPPRGPGSARQPVSCEPCRQRKIKCSRNRVPCDTCRRRQCVESCVYLGTKDIPEPNRDLLARIESLEEMLMRHTGAAAQSEHSTTQRNSGTSTAAFPSPPFESSPSTFAVSPKSLDDQSMAASQQRRSSSSQSPAPQNLGVLTLNPVGDVSYERRSAQWTAILANTGIAAPAMDEENDIGSARLSFPFSTEKVSTFEELVGLLPPRKHCDELKNTYFEVFSPLFHILHDPTFLAQYDAFVNDVSTASLSWLAILFIICSLAVTSLDEHEPIVKDLTRGPDPSESIRSLSRCYREAAMKCLTKQGVFWGRHNVQTLQALILLGYAMSHSQDKTWVLLGMTYNVAVALACHIDPSNFDLNPIECEERRRCWAGLMMLYTIQNAFLGNPDPTWNVSHSVRLPADVNDSDITIAGVHPSGFGPTQVTYLLYKFQLYKLTASICREIFSGKTASRSAISALDHEICAAQECWDARYQADSSSGTLPVAHKMHIHILHAYAHQLFLLLHRPFFAQSIVGLDVPNESQIRCIASAEALLDIHRVIHETPEFKPYLWYSNGLGSFHAFHAAVVLTVAVLMPIYKPQYKRFKEILNETLVRFERLKGRSPICGKAARVISTLLNTPSPNHRPPLPSLSPDLTSSTSGPEFIPSAPLASKQPNESWDIGIYNMEHMRFFADRLQPQQWLTPTSISWNEWDTFLPMYCETTG